MSAEEATIKPDGTTTFEDTTGAADDIPQADEAGADDAGAGADFTEEGAEDIIKGTDPALFLLLAVVAFAVVFIVLRIRRKRASADVDDFFSNLDGDKVSLRLWYALS